MAAVKSLCDKGIVLENGKTSFNGPVDGAIEYYLKNSESFAHRRWDAKTSPKVNFIRLLEAKVLNIHNEIALNHPITDDVNIEFTYEVTQENQLFLHGFNLFNGHNIHILSSHDKQAKSLNNPLPLGIHSTNITIPGNFLAEGAYNCSFAIMRYNPFHVEFHEMEVVGFNIIDEMSNNTVRGNYSGKFPGIVRPLLNWK
jgi:lipopolysaccharide transport system ATP-binding protein